LLITIDERALPAAFKSAKIDHAIASRWDELRADRWPIPALAILDTSARRLPRSPAVRVRLNQQDVNATATRVGDRYGPFYYSRLALTTLFGWAIPLELAPRNRLDRALADLVHCYKVQRARQIQAEDV